MLVVFIGYTAWWISTLVYLNTIPAKGSDNNGNSFDFDESASGLSYYMIFMMYWMTSFFVGLFHMTVAGATAQWYFSRSGIVQPSGSPAFQSFKRSLIAAGSVAYGSLIIAIIDMINYMLRQAERRNSDNLVVWFVICCIRCLVSCIGEIIRFLNRFAYIYVAMYGEDFCTSAKSCWGLMQRNFFDALLVDTIGDMVLGLGKFMGACLSTLILMGGANVTGRTPSIITLVLVVIISLAVFHLVGSLVQSSADTVLVCYAEDLERNRESGNYLINGELHDDIQMRVMTSEKVPFNRGGQA
eukprot:TRINITY_DN1931_c0_g1_i8.p1 TRINITY_DN1931_c0_g1~~TRINITY_DN1931_c0_g1_i8.p1  ORF type:complete len:299 (+),score=90.21 TRINITY_DN1931_c0_g1_i8:790-1686(+)